MSAHPRSGASLPLLAALVLFAACSPSDPTPSAAVVDESSSPTATPSAGASTAPPPSAAASEAPSGPSLGPDADYAALDGVLANPAARDRLPVAVMVDDSVQARPQYGYNAASIVYQAPADGGEDRYMFVYQEQQAKRVEAVRSGRPYFVNWASEYRAAFAHYGGDAKTLLYLPTINGKVIFNIDAIYGSGSAFDRDHKRVAPHNGMTSTAAVRKMAVKHGAPATILNQRRGASVH